jgi:hypothetical protein
MPWERPLLRSAKKLGESLTSIQKFDVPLVQATTSSLDALKSLRFFQPSAGDRTER